MNHETKFQNFQNSKFSKISKFKIFKISRIHEVMNSRLMNHEIRIHVANEFGLDNYCECSKIGRAHV